MPQRIVAIDEPEKVDHVGNATLAKERSRPQGDAKSSEKHHGLSSGAIAGTVVGVVAGAPTMLAKVVVYHILKRRKVRKEARSEKPSKDSNDDSTLPKAGEVDGEASTIRELDQKNAVVPELNADAQPHELQSK